MSGELELCPGRMVGGDQPCFVIAEIGINHQGDVKIAKEMIKVAQECGADCVKFQKREVNAHLNAAAQARPYLNKNSWGPTYGEHKRHLELTHDEFRDLKKYCDELGIFMSSSGMDPEAVNFLAELDLPFLKVASLDTNNMHYLKHTAAKKKPLVVSTGMQDMGTVRMAYKTMKKLCGTNFALLQCTSSYPCPPEDVHLKCLDLFVQEFPDVPIGFSGHEAGIEISLAAVARGAKIVERHFTLDKTMKGGDHMASLEPQELKTLISGIRLIEKALGKPEKVIQASEIPCTKKLGKSVVAGRDLKKGEKLRIDNVLVKCAEPHGIRPNLLDQLIGHEVTRDIPYDVTIDASWVKDWNPNSDVNGAQGDDVKEDCANGELVHVTAQ